MQILIEQQRCPWAGAQPVEIVERKGLGHPDTICDMLSERLSVGLSEHYLEQFGLILHHNVDKALLAAGRSEPAFAAGRILEPIEIFLSGRATMTANGRTIPVRAIAEECTTAWLRENLHALAPDTDIRFHCLVQPGSPELVELFMRQRDNGAFLANDTSCGVGYAPLTELERVVLAVERELNSPQFKKDHPETGEDIKVMGLREYDHISLTVSCAFVSRHLNNLGAYVDAKDQLAAIIRKTAASVTSREIEVRLNAADNLTDGSIFLTVTGTSGEAGDDGQTGRGNRANGLITPCRPVTLEALAGKNPVTHVGKLYNVVASRIAEAIHAEVPGIIDAECHLVSQIGAPIDQPRIVDVRIRCQQDALNLETKDLIRSVAEREIRGTPLLWRTFLMRTTQVA